MFVGKGGLVFLVIDGVECAELMWRKSRITEEKKGRDDGGGWWGGLNFGAKNKSHQ